MSSASPTADLSSSSAYSFPSSGLFFLSRSRRSAIRLLDLSTTNNPNQSQHQASIFPTRSSSPVPALFSIRSDSPTPVASSLPSGPSSSLLTPSHVSFKLSPSPDDSQADQSAQSPQLSLSPRFLPISTLVSLRDYTLAILRYLLTAHYAAQFCELITHRIVHQVLDPVLLSSRLSDSSISQFPDSSSISSLLLCSLSVHESVRKLRSLILTQPALSLHIHYIIRTSYWPPLWQISSFLPDRDGLDGLSSVDSSVNRRLLTLCSAEIFRFRYRLSLLVNHYLIYLLLLELYCISLNFYLIHQLAKNV